MSRCRAGGSTLLEIKYIAIFDAFVIHGWNESNEQDALHVWRRCSGSVLSGDITGVAVAKSTGPCFSCCLLALASCDLESMQRETPTLFTRC